jgi:CheY-like chemotaxis protein
MLFDTKSDSATILFVDDDPSVSEVGKLLLSQLGYSVLCAVSGHQALEIYRKKKDIIDLVLLDMVMPGLSGGETFKELMLLNEKVRVIISSGFFNQDETIQKILDSGGLGFIPKPWDVTKLKCMIQDAIS